MRIALAPAAAILAAALLAAPAHAGLSQPQHVVRDAGDIRDGVARYKRILGRDNAGEPGLHAGGRREITWDGVPDSQASPNGYLSTFFNAPRAPRARGIVLRAGRGGELRVSADGDNPAGAAPRFGDINPQYETQFRTFSPERLFSPVGSNVVEATFYVPGTRRRAAVRGFGAVYTDVDRRESAAFEYFDARGRSLGRFAVPPRPQGLSFLGVAFRAPIVARVRIVYGNRALGPRDGGATDVAVMDDFIYGEPSPLGAPRR